MNYLKQLFSMTFKIQLYFIQLLKFLKSRFS